MIEVNATGVAVPGSAVTVIVNVCAVPTSFTALGLIDTFASTYFFTADPELPCVPSVVRVTSSPPSVTTAVAFAVNVPTLLLLIVSVQVAVLPLTVGEPHVLLDVPGAGLTLGVMDLKVGVPVPSGNALTVIVNV